MSGEAPTRAQAAPAALDQPVATPALRPPEGPAATLSVVIPSHDTRELTLRCLASLAAASPAPTEVIVVDDGSLDGSAEAVAASYPAARLVRHAEPQGFTAAANAGAALAGGELLLLLNSDTEIASEALGALRDAFAGRPRLGVAGAALFYPDGRPQWSGGAAPGALWLLVMASGLATRLGGLASWRRLRAVSGHEQRAVEWVTGAALATRREVWATVGPFDSRFTLYAQDLDFCVRVRDCGWVVAVVPQCRVVHHHGATIANTAGVTAARHNAALLWADLVRWAAKRRGIRGGRRAARLLRFGGALQRAMLLLAGLLGAESPARAAAERGALRAAATAARRGAEERAMQSGSLPPPAERSTTR